MKKNRILTYLVGLVLLVDFFAPPETTRYSLPVPNGDANNYTVITAAPTNDGLAKAVIVAVAADLIREKVSATMSDGSSKKQRGST